MTEVTTEERDEPDAVQLCDECFAQIVKEAYAQYHRRMDHTFEQVVSDSIFFAIADSINLDNVSDDALDALTNDVASALFAAFDESDDIAGLTSPSTMKTPRGSGIGLVG